jgi:hypothetical protein
MTGQHGYRGYPIPLLAELDDITRQTLLRHLTRDCRDAATRNRAIHARRWLTTPPTTRHDTRRTA